MSFPARFRGTCKRCNNPIEVGQHITWNRREKGSAYHADCENPGAIPATASASDYGSSSDEMAARIQESVDAALAKMAAMMAEKTGASVTAVVDHTTGTTTAIVPVSAPATAKPKTLKENAAWHEILATVCENFGDSLIRVLLIGPPGTGKSKTSLVLTSTPFRVTMTEGMGVEDLIGMYQLIKGETVWVDGPVVRAMREGKRILIDEIDHHPTEVGSLLYALLDDAPSIMLPTGEDVQAKPGYGVIATTNSNVTALPEAVLDRFEAVIAAINPHPDALAMFDNAPMRDAVANHFRSLEQSPWQWSGKPTLRRMCAFAKLKPVVGEANALNSVFGSAGRELAGVLATASRGGK